MKKTKKTWLRYSLYVIIGFCCLLGGIIYSRFARDGMVGVLDFSNLLSQTVKETEKKVEEEPVVATTLTEEQINARIAVIEDQIVKETNDPDRNIELRRELYTLKQQLAAKTQ